MEMNTGNTGKNRWPGDAYFPDGTHRPVDKRLFERYDSDYLESLSDEEFFSRRFELSEEDKKELEKNSRLKSDDDSNLMEGNYTMPLILSMKYDISLRFSQGNIITSIN